MKNDSFKQEKLKAYGIEPMVFEKSKDILPSLDLGKFDIGTKIFISFLESEPKEIEVKNKFRTSEKEPETKQAKIISVYVDRIINAEGQNIPYGLKYGMFLTSKSLALGIAKIASNLETWDLLGVKVMIQVSEVDYKNFGTNRCYNVTAL